MKAKQSLISKMLKRKNKRNANPCAAVACHCMAK